MFRLTRQEQFVIGVLVLLVAAVVIGATLPWAGPREPGHRVEVPLNTAPGNGVEKNGQPGEGKQTLVVHVVGAVAAPDTYDLPPGARVRDAVALARPTSEADLAALNLAAKLVDGEKIVVPAKGSTPPVANGGHVGPSGVEDGGDGLVNINTATQAELETLPGIGPVRALGILDYRREHPFRRIEDVMDVSGIGPGTFEKVKNRISVR